MASIYWLGLKTLEALMNKHRYYLEKYASGTIRAFKCPTCSKPTLVTAKRTCGRRETVKACSLCGHREVVNKKYKEEGP